jgi:phosphorylcholine metabolism protein LicD
MKICFILIYLILICLVSLFFYLKIYRKNLDPEILIQKCKKDQINLNILLQKSIPCLESAGILYWLSWGSLLGYFRHDKKMIPWDIDIDLAILKDENFDNKINTLKSELKKIDCKLIWYPIGYRIICKKTRSFIDLYLYHDSGDFLESELYTRIAYKNHQFQKNQTFPLKKDTFEGVKLNISYDGIGWLKKVYGKDVFEKKIINQGKNIIDGLSLNFFGPIYL